MLIYAACGCARLIAKLSAGVKSFLSVFTLELFSEEMEDLHPLIFPGSHSSSMNTSWLKKSYMAQPT